MIHTTLLATCCLAGAFADDESDYYAVDYLTPPDGAVLEVGGMDFLPDGRLVLSTRRGQVWIVENALADDPNDARFTLFAEGLWEGLGLKVIAGDIYVMQRAELSRLLDLDDDGVCDQIDTVADDWGVSGNYHEFAYGLPVDADGNFYVTLNVGFFSPKWWHGKSTVPYRGWALKIAPDGTVSPFASGFRSPCGVGMSPAGDLFVTDNQGDWMPASPVFRVREGGFYGHPASLDWTEDYRNTESLSSDTVPPARAATDREPAAIWLPYKWSRSPGNLVWDETGGRFGPFGGQTFIAELTNGMVLRGDFEEVDGVLQGWVVPFRQKIGSTVRLAFAPDGTLFTGFTNRGWGGLAPADGIGRIRWRETVPFEIASVHLLGQAADAPPGFTVRFTAPPDPDWSAAATADPTAKLSVTQYDYDYWWEYGSPERETVELSVASIDVNENELTFRVDGLEAGRMARVQFFDLASTTEQTLLHDEFAYTLNRMPGTPAGTYTPPIARIVPPPPARESGEEGWLRLTYGDATDAWLFSGWELVEAKLDPADPTRFTTTKGDSHLTNTAGDFPSNYVSRAQFADARIVLDFTLPEGGSADLFVMGCYAIRLSDSEAAPTLTAEHCGAVVGGEGFESHAPEFHAYRGAGQRHTIEIDFEAPRFDASGSKTANARFVRIKIDDVLLQENVEMPGPSAGALTQEASAGAFVIAPNGPIAIGNVRVRPTASGEESTEEGWTPLIDLEADDPLADWIVTEDGTWYVEDEVLIGEGPRSHLFSPRRDFRDVEVRAEMKVSDGGNSGIFLRAPLAKMDWPKGYEAEVNSSFADPNRTGSLIGFSPVLTHLVAPDTWFEYRIRCQTDSEGTHVTLRVNGIVVNDWVDELNAYPVGHIALQQHHDGSVIEVRRLEVREL